jgi:hypothetical protein
VAKAEVAARQFFEGFHAAGRMSKHVWDQLHQLHWIKVLLAFVGINDAGQKGISEIDPMTSLVMLLDGDARHLCSIGRKTRSTIEAEVLETELLVVTLSILICGEESMTTQLVFDELTHAGISQLMVKDSNWAVELVSDEDGQRHLFFERARREQDNRDIRE